MAKQAKNPKPTLKRKRPELTEADVQEQLGRKIFHCIKEVKHATKKAKIFDLQKQIKKLKSLRQKEGSSTDIEIAEAQFASLKDIDLDTLACHAFQTRLKKDKLLSTDDRVKAASTQYFPPFTPAAPSTALGKVQSRLLSSKILASEITRLLDDIRAVVNPISAEVEDGSENEEEVSVSVPSGAVKTKGSTKNLAMAIPRDDDDESVASDGWESGTVDGSNFAEDPQSDSEGSVALESNPETGAEDDEEDISVADSPSAGSDSNLEIAAPPTKKARPEKKTPVGESTFLPSLAVGFTRGDSDSEWSDSEAKVADGIKKNRRGQRARRAIWEKKYGKNAVHVKKQRELAAAERKKPQGVKALDEGWPKRNLQAPQRGPANAARPDRQNQKPSWPSASASRRDQPPLKPQERKNAEAKPLHPSWEAKRKQAEKAKAGIMPHTGTKIKFSD